MSASITTIRTPLTDSFDKAVVAPISSSAEHHGGARTRLSLEHPGARTRLRLTRRGRVVFGGLATLLAIAAFALIAMFGGAQAVAAGDGGDAEFGYIVVEPGASLWQLASEIDPSADPRDLVAEIVRLNKLEGSGVQAGEAIAVPLRYSDAPGVVSASELGMG